MICSFLIVDVSLIDRQADLASGGAFVQILWIDIIKLWKIGLALYAA